MEIENSDPTIKKAVTFLMTLLENETLKADLLDLQNRAIGSLDENKAADRLNYCNEHASYLLELVEAEKAIEVIKHLIEM